MNQIFFKNLDKFEISYKQPFSFIHFSKPICPNLENNSYADLYIFYILLILVEQFDQNEKFWTELFTHDQASNKQYFSNLVKTKFIFLE